MSKKQLKIMRSTSGYVAVATTGIPKHPTLISEIKLTGIASRDIIATKHKKILFFQTETISERGNSYTHKIVS